MSRDELPAKRALRFLRVPGTLKLCSLSETDVADASGRAVPPVERRSVEDLGAVRAAVREEVAQRAAAAGLAETGGARQVGRQLDDRLRERLGLAGRDEQARLAVADELAEPADRRCDHRAGALHRL